jgi:hypothetical protein
VAFTCRACEPVASVCGGSQLWLQLLSRSATAWVIDDEVGQKLEQDLLVAEPLLSYLRYNARMTPSALEDVGHFPHAFDLTAAVSSEDDPAGASSS